MKTKIFLATALVFVIAFAVSMISQKTNQKVPVAEPLRVNQEKQAAYHLARWKYDADMIRDPVTGNVPYGMREKEIEFARTIPARNSTGSLLRTGVQNTYIPAGPDNIGARTRALAYDIRYNGSSNRVLIAGSISGGIYRSADGGASWTRVSPVNEVHNVATVAQDPRPGSQDIWYAGGGEYIGNSAEELGAGYLSFGIFKSTDNGITWTRLPLNTITDIGGGTLGAGSPEQFDNPFDYVHKIAVNPVNGHLYVAGHRRLMRSTDGGATFQVVFGSNVAAFASNGQLDVVCSPTGKIYVGATGAMPDFSLRGVWKSTSGDISSWTRLAGGSNLGVDSVANWRGNSYEFDLVGGDEYYFERRILLALAPSNENILYVLYQNGLLNISPDIEPEADLFKLDMTSGNTWSNLSANVPDFPGGNHEATDPFAIQGGYDMFIAVKPNNPNFVILGGTSLYRSTDGFSTAGYDNTLTWIGGYGRGSISSGLSFHPNSHPDIHNFVFSPNPATPNEAISATDGGLHKTDDITTAGSGVVWTMVSKYQTLQYYFIAMDPGSGRNNFAGGAQDNGTHFRDATGILGTAAADSNRHPRIIGGDGCAVGISQFTGEQYCYGSIQFGDIRRVRLQPNPTSVSIRPNGLTSSFPGSTTEFGEFITNFRLNHDNTQDLYYVNFNRIFRTTSASTVSSSSGWTELTGVSSEVNATNGRDIGIRAMAFSRGAYQASHALYFGTTDGRIFRLDNPRGSAASTTPVDITPPTSVVNISDLNVQDIAVNPNNDNEIIAVISNYGRIVQNALQNVVNIIWTTNAKSANPTWKRAEGNLGSGFISARSCMITVKKDAANNSVTEYYVGTAAGLFGVENLGTTLQANGTPAWQRESPDVINFAVISSLVYRPVDNIMAIGTHGNGMFYTSLGTPNMVTGINDPVLNDKNFISAVWPTFGSNIVQYKTGNMHEIKRISVQLYNMKGQELYRKESGYQNGAVDLSRFAKGAYVLSITSDNRKYRHIQKIVN